MYSSINGPLPDEIAIKTIKFYSTRCFFVNISHLYQVPDEEYRRNLSKKFPAFSKKTLYLNYIYTDNAFRRQHLTTWFIQCIITKENKIFDYIWLRRETCSTLFNKCGFVNFRNAVEDIIGLINFKDYFSSFSIIRGKLLIQTM